jgi:hypothetical protein
MSDHSALQQDPLNMSDEELMKMAPPEFASEASVETLLEEEENSQEPEAQEPEANEVEEPTESLEASDETQGEESPTTEVTQPESEEEQTPLPSTEAAAIDYEAEYKRLLAPFKANGREVTVSSVDDAVALMQMGVNYNKKMAGLKPHLKVLKMLENQGLLDEKELSHLIDLKQRKPGAIEKLMKDSGLDPMDIDADKADSYTPGSYSVADQEIELDQVIEEIKDSPSFSRTVDLVSNKWDAKSKEEVAKFPQGLKIINDLVESGAHDLIMTELENQRLFGRLQGLSDLEAYRQVGDSLHARGAFDHLGRQGYQAPAASKVVVPNPKKEDDSKLREQRRAASPTKVGATGAVKPTFDPLALSDEEFSKLSTERFL